MKWFLVSIAGVAIACSTFAGNSRSAEANAPAFARSESPIQTRSSRFDRVIYIVLENTDYDGAIRNPILKEFADLGIQFDQMLAATHPSQGNYIEMIAGDTLGVDSDSDFNIAASQKHLGDLLERKGLDWRVYAEGNPGNCFLGGRSGSYARKHVPFLSFLNVTQDPARCAKIMNSESFAWDWANNQLPAFTLYIPDLNNDGHDTGVNYAANWFQNLFGYALKDSRLMYRTLIIVTFDESESYSRANQIYTAMYSPQLPTGLHVKAKHSHDSLLKMIEDEWSLGNLGRADRTAPAIQELKPTKH